jgi:hypothetical protein
MVTIELPKAAKDDVGAQALLEKKLGLPPEIDLHS